MKRLKKVLAGILALALVFSVTTAPAFAGILDEMKTGNNAMAVVMVEIRIVKSCRRSAT